MDNDILEETTNEVIENYFSDVIPFKTKRIGKFLFIGMSKEQEKGFSGDNALDFKAIIQSDSEDNDMTAAYFAGLALRHFILARLYAFKFLDANMKEQEDRIHGRLK